MHEHPTQGMQGVKAAIKPRFKSAREELPEYSREYLIQRNGQMKAKNLTAQLELAIRRGQLVSKELVERQAAFLFIAMRRKILNLPSTYARRLTGLNDIQEVRKILEGAAHSILNEIKDLPQTIEPGWLKEVEKEGK